jgi:sperm-associated antigen 16 protein
VSCSIDHSAKLWDLKSERCRHTFRGHIDSVNYVVFQPSSNCFATASGDKTISLWDLRSGLCVQTFFGHSNAVNHLAFNAPGDQIASCDADGVVKLWDIRTVNQFLDIPSSTGKSANRVSFERSGSLIMSAGDDCLIRVRNAKTGEELSALKGHDDSVQSMAMNPAGTIMVSAGSDSTFCLWGL